VRIAGRLALQPGTGSDIPPEVSASRLCGYHGIDVVVCTLSEHDFEAELATPLPAGTMVRLRLPGAGMMVAHVERSLGGRVSGRFVNPVGAARLGKTLGFARAEAA
jgi:hypothetical protein